MIDYIDYDTLVKIGWTALLGWNLKETVANGKKVAVLEAKISNGLTAGMDSIREKIEAHIDGEETRIIQAIIRDTRAGATHRTRVGDQED